MSVITARGTFSFKVPLKHTFGFCDDCNKIVYGVRHTLTLVQKSDDAIFRAAATAAGKVTLDKISLFMPQVFRYGKNGAFQNYRCKNILYCSLPNQQFWRAYDDAAMFSEKFYRMNELITGYNITPADFKDLFPLMVFDVSNQSERLKPSLVDVQMEATFNIMVPAGTQAYMHLLSQTMLQIPV